MTRRVFLIVLGLTLVACVLCPYVEIAIHWNQTVFDTGYDGESTVAVIALVLILAFAVAKLLVSFVQVSWGQERLVESKWVFSPVLDIISFSREASPPLPLRI